MARDLGDWSVAELAAAAASSVRAEMLAGCSLLRIAACWADKHPGDGLPLEIKLNNGVDERRLVVAGDGTPDVAEGAAADFGLETRMSPGVAKALIADALDLRHRFPCLWSRIEAGTVPAWQARLIAQKTRHLRIQQVGSIDRCIAGHLGNLSKTRLESLVDAEILRVDKEAREKAANEALDDRDIRFGRPNEDSMVEFWGSLPAIDARHMDASLDRLTDILIARKDDLPAGVPARGAKTKKAWRAVAVALYTNNPVLALQLLMEDQQPDLFSDARVTATAGQESPETDGQDSGGDADLDGRHASGESEVAPNARRDAEAAARARLVSEIAGRIDPAKLIPTETLHIHLSAEAFSKRDEHVARVEKIGPALLSTIRTWLGEGCRVSVQPVLDPDHITPIDRYETPDRMRDALLARTPASVFPWTGSLNRRNDLDHSVPYLPPPAGPPGQTGLHNLGPLTRPEHRAKTIGHMSLRQPRPGVYVWKTRYGRVLITNDTGTHDLGNVKTDDLAQHIWDTADRMQQLHALDVA